MSYTATFTLLTPLHHCVDLLSKSVSHLRAIYLERTALLEIWCLPLTHFATKMARVIRLQQSVGLQGTVLKWFKSYLSNRTFSVALNDVSSATAPLSSGVPQGSILGPILLTLYMLPLGQIISTHNISFHLYADDLQLYLPVIPGVTSALDSLYTCLRDIKNWLSDNFLHLNEGKTEYIIFSPDSPHNTTVFHNCPELRGHF